MIKVLTIGHLPKYVGGKQSSGLSNVIWNICNSSNKTYKNFTFENRLLSTDLNSFYSKIDKTDIYGILNIFLIIIFPFHFLKLLYTSLNLYNKYNFNFFNTFFKLCLFIVVYKRYKPNYVHIHGTTSFIYTKALTTNTAIFIYTIHGITGNDINLNNTINNYLIENHINTLNFKCLTFVSTQVRSEWIKLYGNIISPNEVILNSCDYDLYKFENIYKKSKKIKIATIGSFSSLKGQDIVIQSLIKSNIEFIYYCVGSSSVYDRNKYKKFNFFNKSKIIFIEYLPPKKLKYFYNALDYSILMSSSEGFGLVILESIACGTPVIIPEYLPIVYEKNIIDKSNSIVLKSRDIDLLVNLFINIRNYSFNKHKISYSLNKTLNWENITHKYLNIYNE